MWVTISISLCESLLLRKVQMYDSSAKWRLHILVKPCSWENGSSNADLLCIGRPLATLKKNVLLMSEGWIDESQRPNWWVYISQIHMNGRYFSTWHSSRCSGDCTKRPLYGNVNNFQCVFLNWKWYIYVEWMNECVKAYGAVGEKCMWYFPISNPFAFIVFNCRLHS